MVLGWPEGKFSEGMGGEVMGLRTEMLTAGVLNGLSTVYKKS